METGIDLMKAYVEEEEEDVVAQFQAGLTAEEKLEFICVAEKMLFFGPSAGMKRFVRAVLEKCGDVPTGVKCRVLEQVCEADDPSYVSTLRLWIANDDMEPTCRADWLKQLSYYPTYADGLHAEDWVGLVFSRIDSPFHRNRVVRDAMRAYDENGRFGVFVDVMRRYKQVFDDPVMYRVTFAQEIVRREDCPEFVVECLDDLLRVMTDPNEPFETQADVCDFFLNTPEGIDPSYHAQAEEKMRELFRENLLSELSVYANRQNVHSASIEASAQEVVEKLHEKYGVRPTTPEQLQQWRLDMEEWSAFAALDDASQQKVLLCVSRIFFDKRLYGSTKDTLSSIFGLVWRHIASSDHQSDLQKRLLEELVEASGQCSTGIAMRLANTLSGYDDFMLRLSYREDILSKVVHHMNKHVMADEDQERLLYQMTLPHSRYTDRKDFLSFLRTRIPSIKEELYAEYKDVVSDTDFDLYLKQAILVYEGQV